MKYPQEIEVVLRLDATEFNRMIGECAARIERLIARATEAGIEIKTASTGFTERDVVRSVIQSAKSEARQQ